MGVQQRDRRLADAGRVRRHRRRRGPAYLEYFGLRSPDNDARTMVEIGAGIGRMTCAFTREFGSVIACDLDPGFLERCYETVGRFGKVDRLRTRARSPTARRSTCPTTAPTWRSATSRSSTARSTMPSTSSAEAVRVVRPGGKVVLNFRAPAASDVVVVPAGALMRAAVPHPHDRRLADPPAQPDPGGVAGVAAASRSGDRPAPAATRRRRGVDQRPQPHHRLRRHPPQLRRHQQAPLVADRHRRLIGTHRIGRASQR